MYIFRQHIKRKFGWSIDLLENIKINILELLKNTDI